MLCDVCHNIMDIQMDQRVLYRICRTCLNKVKAAPEDSLRHEEIKTTSIEMNVQQLQLAADDPMNKKVRFNCTTCKDAAAIGRLFCIPGEVPMYVTICTKCKTYTPGYTIE